MISSMLSIAIICQLASKRMERGLPEREVKFSDLTAMLITGYVQMTGGLKAWNMIT